MLSIDVIIYMILLSIDVVMSLYIDVVMFYLYDAIMLLSI